MVGVGVVVVVVVGVVVGVGVGVVVVVVVVVGVVVGVGVGVVVGVAMTERRSSRKGIATTIYFPPDLYTWLRHRSAETRRPLTRIVADYCQQGAARDIAAEAQEASQ